MGASCCGNPPLGLEPSPSIHEHDHDHHDVNNNQEGPKKTCCGDCDEPAKLDDCCGGDDSHDQHSERDACNDHPEADASSTSSDTWSCCSTEERCDEKCIYAAAAVECEKACEQDDKHQDSPGHPHIHRQDGHEATSACNTHLQAAFDQYSNYLAQLRCICRSVISQNANSLQTCCGSKARPVKRAKHTGAKCGKKQGNIAIKTPVLNLPQTETPKNTDPEKTSNVQTIGFLVTGMDCTSCAEKLLRILNTTTGVSQAQVNFVMGKGELSLDTEVTDADEVLRFASSVSGFSISKIIAGSYFLDVIASTAEGKRLVSDPPVGVVDVQLLDKKTVRLVYEPSVIGARDLFHLLKDSCEGLAPPRGDAQLESSRRRLWDQFVKTVMAAALTIPVAVLAWGHELVEKKTKGIVSLVLATLVQGVAVPEFYYPALSTFWYSRTIAMDMLVVMSITAAYLYSVVAFGFDMAGKPLQEGEFFETSTMLVTLILLGRLIAAVARVQAINAVSLRSKHNITAILVDGDHDVEIDARLLQFGDRFKVPPHTRVPTDGIVISGQSEVNESMLTGESLPIMKKKGDSLIAGTVNGDGTVVAQLTRLPGKNTVVDIAQLVEEAAKSKPKLQSMADRVAGWFVPAMSAITVVVFVIWIACGIERLDYTTGKAVGNAITYAVAALAVACPCALGLAVPMVLVVAGGVAAREGVVIKSADVTEGARKTTDVVLDKTGTITETDLAVVEQINLHGDENTNIALTKALVSGGKHPVSAAVEAHLKNHAAEPMPGTDCINVIPGKGIEAKYHESQLRAGNARWTGTDSVSAVAQFEQAGLTTLVITKDSVPLMAFGLSVRIRPEASRVIAELKARNIRVHIVSGDQDMAVKAVASAVGILAENVASEKTPTEKRDYVAALMQDQSRHVLFCGDGTNDAVAVAQANVGVQMGGGLVNSDVTQGAADVVLLSGLDGIIVLLDISRASFHRMVFNFGWSAVYNLLAVTMASGAWVRFRIPPAYAGLGEVVSVVPVIIAAVSMFLVNLRRPYSSV